MALFTFTSVAQIRDYADKNHMNTHYFCCSDLNKLIIIIIIIIVIVIIIKIIIIIRIIAIIKIIIIMIIIMIKMIIKILISDSNSKKIKHYISFSVGSVNK